MDWAGCWGAGTQASKWLFPLNQCSVTQGLSPATGSSGHSQRPGSRLSLGVQRGAWVGSGRPDTAGELAVCGLPPMGLSDACFNTCRWVICTIKFLKKCFESLIYLFVIVFHNSFHSKARTCFQIDLLNPVALVLQRDTGKEQRHIPQV